MSPQEYLKTKQAEAPPKELGDASHVEHFTEEEKRAYLQAILESDYLVRLYEANIARVPTPIQELYRTGALALGEVNSPVPRAYYDPEGPVVVFHLGLKDFIYRIVRIQASRIIQSKEDLDAVTQDDPANDPIHGRFASIFWWIRETGLTAFGPAYPITKNQISLANFLALEAEFFFVSHEFGHMFHGQIDAPGNDLLARIQEGLGNDDHAEEFFCDRFAMLACLGYFADENFASEHVTPWNYLGLEMALMVFACLELLDKPFGDSHPKFGDRISNLRNFLSSMLNDEEKYKQLTRLADRSLGLYVTLLEKVPRYFTGVSIDPGPEAEAHRRDIRDLLERCSNGPRADFESFTPAIITLLNRGYHDVLADEIAGVGREYAAFSEQHRERIFSDLAHHPTVHKFKLLVGFLLVDVPEPARSYFMEKIDPRVPKDTAAVAS